MSEQAGFLTNLQEKKKSNMQEKKRSKTCFQLVSYT